jgi:hypothetical protein
MPVALWTGDEGAKHHGVREPVEHLLVGHLLRVLLKQLDQLVFGQAPLEHVAVVVDLFHLFLDGLLLFGVLGSRLFLLFFLLLWIKRRVDTGLEKDRVAVLRNPERRL